MLPVIVPNLLVRLMYAMDSTMFHLVSEAASAEPFLLLSAHRCSQETSAVLNTQELLYISPSRASTLPVRLYPGRLRNAAAAAEAAAAAAAAAGHFLVKSFVVSFLLEFDL